MADEKSLLDLSTDAPVRPVVKIDGTPYPIALLRDFTAADRLRLRRDGLKLKAIYDKPDPSDDELVKLQEIIEDWSGRVLPGAPMDKLDSDQKGEILHAFFDEAGLTQAPETSPDSSASTAEAGETGS